MNREFLPIGTVCRLKNGQKNIMIIGFCPVTAETEKGMYDYCGCLYPEGVISSDMNLLFDHYQIEEIIFKGLENDEEKIFKSKLLETLNKKFNTMDNSKEIKNLDNSSIEIPVLVQQEVSSENSNLTDSSILLDNIEQVRTNSNQQTEILNIED